MKGSKVKTNQKIGTIKKQKTFYRFSFGKIIIQSIQKIGL